MKEKIYKINNVMSVNCEEDNEDMVLQFKINLHITGNMLKHIVASYVYEVKSCLECGEITQEKADKLLSEAGLSEISYEITDDLREKIKGYHTDRRLRQRYDALVKTEYHKACLDIFKRIKNEISNIKQQFKETAEK